jgi:hypothetical protein
MMATWGQSFNGATMRSGWVVQCVDTQLGRAMWMVDHWDSVVGERERWARNQEGCRREWWRNFREEISDAGLCILVIAIILWGALLMRSMPGEVVSSILRFMP